MERIEYFSPISFSKITIGGVTQTPQGFWLPKIKTGPGNYRNIKDGVGQLTRAQAINCIVRAYYDQTGKKRGWTQQEIEERLHKAHQLELENQHQKLAREVQHLVEVENQKENQESPIKIKTEHFGVFNGYFRFYSVRDLISDSLIYKVKIIKKSGWKKIRDRVYSLGLGDEAQLCWAFESFGAASSFISFIQKTEVFGSSKAESNDE